MRIVYLHHANVCRGGIERMFAQKATILADQKGWEVVMLTYEQNGEPFPYPLPSSVRQVNLGVRLYAAYQVPYPLRYFKKIMLRRQLSAAIRHFLQSWKPDIVICTDKDAHEMDALFKAHTTEKLIVEAHTGMIDHEFQVLSTKNFLKRLIARKNVWRLKQSVSHFDLLVALTADDARCWQPYVPTVVIPNSLPYFPPHAADLTAVRYRVIAVGRLNRQKGFDRLLQAWQTVQQRHPEWQLDIYGDGTEREALMAQCQALNLTTVTLHPSTADIYAEYTRSDFLVCSSRWESFGIVLIEAMACGIPVVSFDCDNGPRNIVTHGQDGLLVADGDNRQLADAICWLMEHPDRRQLMGAAARRHVHRYRVEHLLPQYLKQYNQITNRQIHKQ